MAHLDHLVVVQKSRQWYSLLRARWRRDGYTFLLISGKVEIGFPFLISTKLLLSSPPSIFLHLLSSQATLPCLLKFGKWTLSC